ncbi:hypothetical protein TIFTF001_002920 [Ficus carica]|uniref:RNase H type-1 domain-containing protein n=1 Tax=Ficus carica TaxID=3494 RepID=A0AA87Z5Q6_FICCA|nr:hypothetical protein TIFTF001_002920 [Ficus carica]
MIAWAMWESTFVTSNLHLDHLRIHLDHLRNLQQWGLVKINVDAAARESKEFIGLGLLVARDESGVVLGAVARLTFGTFSPYLGECMAVIEGVWFARSLGFPSWIVETDALNAVHVIDDPAYRSVEAMSLMTSAMFYFHMEVVRFAMVLAVII